MIVLLFGGVFGDTRLNKWIFVVYRMELDDEFSSSFRSLTRRGTRDGFEPLHWQRRLFKQFCQNDIPKVCDLPTGMGKTNVIHLWLLALRRQIKEKNLRLPRRLVYVVDRRTVVDQATVIAEGIKKNLASLDPEDCLSVSTLRGQFADNREWTIDPSRPAIIIGTVDMIGSRLLFSGYRSSYKLRPLDAGLLGQDTLLVLDEAHLSEPFAKLIHALSDDGTFQSKAGLPMRVMCMSATGTGEDEAAFKLEDCDLAGDRETNPIIQRYESTKRLTIEPPADKSAVETGIIDTAASLAGDNSRVVVFVRLPDEARKVATALRKLKPFANAVEVLTGTVRGLERDKLLEKPVLKRFLDGDERPEHRTGKEPAILVSTSAGEVGFDLNADHLVCDAAPLDSMIQRLGRVNRRGYGDATVRIFVAEPKNDEKPDKKPKRTYESATAEAIRCLEALAKTNGDGTRSASPKAIDELKVRLTKQQLLAASTPKPTTVELTDILLDAWSMTSITDPMPGRPPVAPWLRGIAEDLPQTTIAWRAELEFLRDGGVGLKAIETILQKHRIRPHETLTTRTDYVVDFLKRVVKIRPSLSETRVLLLGRELTLTSIRELFDDPSPLRADPTLVFPATFGGLDEKGMLDDRCIAHEAGPESPCAPLPLDVADAPGYERRTADTPRLRLLLEHSEDAWTVKAIPGATLPESLQDVPGDLAGLVDFIKNRLRMNLRLRQPLMTNDEGDVTQYLVSLYPARSKKPTSDQSLDCHVKAVEACAARIAQELQLAEPFRAAFLFAAKYHDEGKRTGTWQHAIGNKDLSRPLGKSGGKMNVKRLGGYRHEFGSLLRITDPKQSATDLPANTESLDLMLHLIAVHHGNGRPHFKRPDDVDYYDRKRCPQIAIEAIRRFASLQRRYGHWRLAWLENLIRCADAMASAENDEEET
jgi:CRISPR-associated endonuclease/helicase Cas3